jgi:uncharacterized protein
VKKPAKIKKDITDVFAKQQRKLLKDLRAQAKDLTGVLKLLAASQDTDAVRKEHMEFLGTVGSRTLTSKELAMAKEGIPLDELRKICGNKMLAIERHQSIREALPQGHILRLIYAEHELLLYLISNLEVLTASLGKTTDWHDNKKIFEKITHIVHQICGLDNHQLREERIIFPKLTAYGYEVLPQSLCAEHDRLHKARAELKMLGDSVERMAFHKWKEQWDEALGGFARGTREHIFKEDNILYPKALKVIQDPQIWDSIKAACDEIGICCL